MNPETQDRALRLVGLVREHDQAAIRDLLGSLDRRQVNALAIGLAELVPDDVPVSELLAWQEDAGSPEQHRRLHATFVRLRAQGLSIEQLPVYVRLGEQRYQAAAYAARKASGTGARWARRDAS